MSERLDTISLMYAWVLLLSQFVTFLAKIYKPDLSAHTKSGMIEEQYTVMRFLDLKETSTDMAADWIFEKFKLI